MFATVRDYLNQYPDTAIDLLTPAGMVKIPPRQGRNLLSPGGGRQRFPVCGSNTKIPASELLEQQICKIVSYRGDPWRVFMLVNPPEKMAHRRMSSEVLYEQVSFMDNE